jgi:hypothetical protein
MLSLFILFYRIDVFSVIHEYFRTPLKVDLSLQQISRAVENIRLKTHKFYFDR